MGKTNTDDSLFKAEQEALKAALATSGDARYRGNALLPHYKLLADEYRKLLRVTKKVFYISDSQGQSLQRHQNEIQNLLDNANQGFLTFGPDLKVDGQYSAECVRIFGRKIAGLPIAGLLSGGDAEAEARLKEVINRVFSCGEAARQSELRHFPPFFRIGDKNVQAECKVISQEDEAAEQTLIMMILTDITERLQAEEKIRFLSYHDKLTSLYNRAHIETVSPGLEKAEYLPLSIIMADVNGLKLVNDVFGHEQGDWLLVAMAKALQKSCRQTDIIARWGGDEFLILLPKTDSQSCRQVCERIGDACVQVRDLPIPLSAAVGMATQEKGVARLGKMFSVAEDRMYADKLKNSREVRKNIIANLQGVLHNFCFEDAGHVKRVKMLAADFASFLGLEAEAAEMTMLKRLAELHDIGKVAIPAEILGKAGALTPPEWEVVKSHSDIGYRMARSIGEQALADIILALHERWDGKGYPFGLKEAQIPFLARAFALVEVYDVVTHDQPYRAARSPAAALLEIASGSGGHFDPELARGFMDFIKGKRGQGR